MRIRTVVRLLAILCAAGVSGAQARQADLPYYRLNYADYDTTYEAQDANALRFARFYWDGQLYCRYRTGWNGPGAYRIGTRDRPGLGWDGGYPWQGPGTPADHDDDAAFAQAQVDYAREFGQAPVCEPQVYRRIHRVVLRRKG